MNDKLPRSIQQLILSILPYLITGFAIACIIGLLILFYYIMLWGLLIGAVLWLIAWIKQYFSKKNTSNQPHKGRIIDHERKK